MFYWLSSLEPSRAAKSIIASFEAVTRTLLARRSLGGLPNPPLVLGSALVFEPFEVMNNIPALLNHLDANREAFKLLRAPLWVSTSRFSDDRRMYFTFFHSNPACFRPVAHVEPGLRLHLG